MNAKVASSLSTGTLAPDRKTQYFKITIWSIALHFGIAIALAGFYPYCYTESAIFEKGDRAE